MARIVSFELNGRQGFGVLDAEGANVCDFTRLDQSRYGAGTFIGDAMSLIELGAEGVDIANRIVHDEQNWPDDVRLSLSSVRLLPPLPRPLTVRDFVSFEKHLLQCARQHFGHDEWRPPEIWYQRPVYYRGNPLSFVGHDTEVPVPQVTQKFDYELELGFIIGRKGRDIPVDKAMDYVFGLTIFNDFTARDVQGSDKDVYMGPCRSKDYDACNAMGPWIATLDEIPDPMDLDMKIRLNGEEIGAGNSGDARFSIADMISFASQETMIYPGEFMATGTVGDGAGLEKGIAIKGGDVVELEISRLGVLRNHIVSA
ncbi:MAG: fumarylacetoacetate hydrolase family protein [Pseudomonadota bacterium]